MVCVPYFCVGSMFENWIKRIFLIALFSWAPIVHRCIELKNYIWLTPSTNKWSKTQWTSTTYRQVSTTIQLSFTSEISNTVRFCHHVWIWICFWSNYVNNLTIEKKFLEKKINGSKVHNIYFLKKNQWKKSPTRITDAKSKSKRNLK